MEHRLSLDQHSALHPSQVSENTLLHWDGPRTSRNHPPGSTAESQREWPGMHSVSGNPCASISHERLDSGLGSYESQYSDIAHSHSKPYRPRPQQHQPLPPGSRHTSMQVERQGTPSACRCCSHIPPTTASPQHCCSPNLELQPQPRYDTYPPFMYPPSMQHHYSLPSHPQNGGPHHHHQQQKYWSDPFQGLPQARTPCSLPGPVHSPAPPHSPTCSYGEHQYHSWARPQPPPTTAFNPERVELRKKLQAIFNPSQVDTVMEMFPHVMDAQKLAAEILNLKSLGRMF